MSLTPHKHRLCNITVVQNLVVEQCQCKETNELFSMLLGDIAKDIDKEGIHYQ